jgi:hypothetical protein
MLTSTPVENRMVRDVTRPDYDAAGLTDPILCRSADSSERKHFRDVSLERYHMCENHIAISQPSTSAIGPGHITSPHFVNRIYCFLVLCQFANAQD